MYDLRLCAAGVPGQRLQPASLAAAAAAAPAKPYQGLQQWPSHALAGRLPSLVPAGSIWAHLVPEVRAGQAG